MRTYKLFSFVMAVISLASLQLSSISTFAGEAPAEEKSVICTGTCGAEGDNIIWTYDVATQTMTFSGTGKMESFVENHDYANRKMPDWLYTVPEQTGQYYEAKNIVFEEGITEVGCVIREMFSLHEESGFTMTIPESMIDIDFKFFFGSGVNKNEITFYGKYGSWFYYCSGLEMIPTGIAESPYYPPSGETENGTSWEFDYETAILQLDGNGTLNDTDAFSGPLGKASKIYIGKDLQVEPSTVITAPEVDHTLYYNFTVYLWTFVFPDGMEKRYTIYTNKESNFAKAYEECIEGLTYNFVTKGALEPLVSVKYVESPMDISCGDVNQDGKVDLLDAIFLNKYTSKQVTFTEAQTVAADCNRDGDITDLDVTALLDFILLLIPALPASTS